MLAAAYGFGLAKNHAFSDGNKRAAALAATTFLEANGFRIGARIGVVAKVFIATAASELDEEGLAEQLRLWTAA